MEQKKKLVVKSTPKSVARCVYVKNALRMLQEGFNLGCLEDCLKDAGARGRSAGRGPFSKGTPSERRKLVGKSSPKPVAR